MQKPTFNVQIKCEPTKQVSKDGKHINEELQKAIIIEHRHE